MTLGMQRVIIQTAPSLPLALAGTPWRPASAVTTEGAPLRPAEASSQKKRAVSVLGPGRDNGPAAQRHDRLLGLSKGAACDLARDCLVGAVGALVLCAGSTIVWSVAEGTRVPTRLGTRLPVCLSPPPPRCRCFPFRVPPSSCRASLRVIPQNAPRKHRIRSRHLTAVILVLSCYTQINLRGACSRGNPASQRGGCGFNAGQQAIS